MFPIHLKTEIRALFILRSFKLEVWCDLRFALSRKREVLALKKIVQLIHFKIGGNNFIIYLE